MTMGKLFAGEKNCRLCLCQIVGAKKMQLSFVDHKKRSCRGGSRNFEHIYTETIIYV
jgi:hypothetical protein